jgi:hypothetical protein
LEGHSARQAERKLLELASPENKKKQLEKITPIDKDLTQLKVALSAEVLVKLEKIKGLLSHRHRNLGWGELIGILADIAIEKLDPAASPPSSRTMRKKASSGNQPQPEDPGYGRLGRRLDPVSRPGGDPPRAKAQSLPRLDEIELTTCSPNATEPFDDTPADAPPAPPTLETRKEFRRVHLNVATKREVWKRDQGRCQYVDPKTDRKCGSQYFVQIEHRVPVCRGGTNDPANLTLHCFHHNQLTATQTLGRAFMSRFTQKPAS